MRNFWENIKILLSFVFCGVAFLLPPIILLFIDFDETINNIILFVLMISICIIGYIIYHDLKIISNVSYVLDNIETLYDYKFNKKDMKLRVYHECGTFKKIAKCNLIFKDKKRNDIISKRSNGEYIYSYISALHTFSNEKFNYELFDYCERMMFDKFNYERNYIRNCLNLMLISNRKYLNDYKFNEVLNLLCRKLSSIDYPYYDNQDALFDLNRIISYVKSARETIKEENPLSCKEIEEICNLYIEYLKYNKEKAYYLKNKKYEIIYVDGNETFLEKTDSEALKNINEKTGNKQNGKFADAKWEHLYKTDFESFWNMAVNEYDLSKLPDRIGNLRDDTMLYGEEARSCFLSRLRSAIKPSTIYANTQWNDLMQIKRELEEKNPNTRIYMLDIIREYEHRYIKY